METLYLVGKILISIIFIAMTIGMVYLCFKARVIKEKCAQLEKLCVEDIKRFYDTGSAVTKIVVEFILARYSLDLNKFTK